MNATLALTLAVLVFGSAPAAAQAPSRATPSPSPAPTGALNGVVTSDEEGKQPVRRAVITIRGERDFEVITTTDQDGRFQQTGLPADRYTIIASRPSYLSITYGAKQTGRSGVPLLLAAGETRTISLVMPRGAVITGTVLGTDGLPAAGVTVTAMRPVIANGDRVLIGSAVAPAGQADDRGRYRIWGLPPDKYVIVARPAASMARGMAIGAEAGSERNVTYAPIYFPGTADLGAAQWLQVASGQELSGIDLPMQLLPSATISGVLATEDDSPLPAGVRLLVLRATTGLAPYDAGESVPVGSNGRFEAPSLPPGRYVVRLQNPVPALGSTLTGVVNGGFWARTEVELDGHPIKDLVVTLRRGFQLRGTIAFGSREGSPPPDPSAITVSLDAVTVDGVKPSSPPVVRPDSSGAFTISGLGPGRYRVNAVFPAIAARTIGWHLKSVSAGGEVLQGDVLEIPSTGVAGSISVVFGPTPNEVSGRLVVSDGTPAPDYFIVLFPADEMRWVNQSRNIQNTRPGTDGVFKFTNPPAGSYFLCALDDLQTADLADREFLRSLVPGAVRIQVEPDKPAILTLQVGKR